jgi:hypothetical protein
MDADQFARTIEYGTRPAAEHTDVELLTLYQEISARFALYDTKALFDRLSECKAELERRLARAQLPASPAVSVDEATAMRFAAKVVELYDDATMADGDYMLTSTECAGIINALADRAQQASAEPVADAAIEALAHRRAWRYKHSADPHHSHTYTFNRDWLLVFARDLLAASPPPTASVDVKGMLPAERDCCGTLPGSAHRSTWQR